MNIRLSLVVGAALAAVACRQPAEAPVREDDESAAAILLESLSIEAAPAGAAFTLFPKAFDAGQKNYLVQFEQTVDAFTVRFKSPSGAVLSVDDGAPLTAEADGRYRLLAKDQTATITITGAAGKKNEYQVNFQAVAAGAAGSGMQKVELSAGGAAGEWTIPASGRRGAYFAYVTFTGEKKAARLPLSALSETPALLSVGAPVRFSSWTASGAGDIAITDGEPAISAVYLGPEFYYHFLYDKADTDEAIAGGGAGALVSLAAELTGVKDNVNDITGVQIPAAQARLADLEAKESALTNTTLPGIRADIQTASNEAAQQRADLDRLDRELATLSYSKSGLSLGTGTLLIDEKVTNRMYFAYVTFVNGDVELVIFSDVITTLSVGQAQSVWTRNADDSISITQGTIGISGMWAGEAYDYQVASRLLSGQAAANANLTAALNRIAALESWKASAEQSLTALRADVNAAAQQLTALENAKDDHKKRIETLEAAVTQLNADVNTANAGIGAINVSLASVSGAVQTVTNDLAALKAAFGSHAMSANYGWTQAKGQGGTYYAKLATLSLPAGSAGGMREARGSFSISQDIPTGTSGAVAGTFTLEAAGGAGDFGPAGARLFAWGAVNAGGVNLGFAPAGADSLVIYAESDRQLAVADVKIELARAGSSLLTIAAEHGSIWTQAQPSGYTGFIKELAANATDSVSGAAAGTPMDASICQIANQKIIRYGKVRHLYFDAKIVKGGNAGLQLTDPIDYPVTTVNVTVYANWESGKSADRFGNWQLSGSNCKVNWPNGSTGGKAGDNYIVQMTYLAK